MKYLLLLTAALLTLASCRKESCYTCTTYKNITPANFADTTRVVQEVCEMTADEARQFEEDGTRTVATNGSGTSVIYRETTICE